ncbi:MAG: sulfatase-like hydrolase/transferase [Oceanococcus sp.]
MKWIIRIAVVLILIAGGLFLARDTLILHLPGYVDALHNPMGPPREVHWGQGPETAEKSPTERPPNIVLILADDLGFNDISFWGGGVAGGSVPTPHINSIGQDGVAFRAGYSGNGTCAPSRAAIMSGRYPTRFGFEFTPTPGNMLPILNRLYMQNPKLRDPIFYGDQAEAALPFEQMGMPAEEITLAELLRDAGYYTAHIGKWHLGRAAGMAPHEQGFADSLLMASGKYLPDDDPNVVNSKQDFDPIDRFLWPTFKHASSFNGSERFPPPGYITDNYTDEAIKVIEQNRNRPFFLYLAQWAVHTPLQALKADYDALDHIEDHRLRVYAAMVRSLDRSVGRVLEALRANGLEENTLVIFSSDNGGAHYVGLPEINKPYRGWKISFFEGGIHVPFFMKWPKQIAAGSSFEEPIHHFDIFGTAAAAAGAELPTDRTMDGKDLLPYIQQKRSGAPHQELFWRQGHYQVVISDGWKLQTAERPKKTWLFYLKTDPTEQHNVAAENPALVATLLAKLAKHDAEQIAPAWPALIEAPIPIDKTMDQVESADDEYVYWPN